MKPLRPNISIYTSGALHSGGFFVSSAFETVFPGLETLVCGGSSCHEDIVSGDGGHVLDFLVPPKEGLLVDRDPYFDALSGRDADPCESSQSLVGTGGVGRFTDIELNDFGAFTFSSVPDLDFNVSVLYLGFTVSEL